MAKWLTLGRRQAAAPNRKWLGAGKEVVVYVLLAGCLSQSISQSVSLSICDNRFDRLVIGSPPNRLTRCQCTMGEGDIKFDL